MKQQHFTRRKLAKRYDVSERTVDRWREQGLIAWLDLSGSRSLRPSVRFTLDAVLEFEKNCLMDIRKEKRND